MTVKISQLPPLEIVPGEAIVPVVSEGDNYIVSVANLRVSAADEIPPAISQGEGNPGEATSYARADHTHAMYAVPAGALVANMSSEESTPTGVLPQEVIYRTLDGPGNARQRVAPEFSREISSLPVSGSFPLEVQFEEEGLYEVCALILLKGPVNYEMGRIYVIVEISNASRVISSRLEQDAGASLIVSSAVSDMKLTCTIANNGAVALAGRVDVGWSCRDLLNVEPFDPNDIEGLMFEINSAKSGGTISGGYFESFPNRGSAGGTLIASGAARPAVSIYPGTDKDAPLFIPASGTICAMASSLTASTFGFLHDPTSQYTITQRVRADDSSTGSKIYLNTFQSSSATNGIAVFGDSTRIGLTIGKSVSGQWAFNQSTALGVIENEQEFVWQLVKNELSLTLYVDGISVLSGTLNSPSTANPATTLRIGGYANGSFCRGHIPYTAVHQKALTSEELAEMRSYATNGWYL